MITNLKKNFTQIFDDKNDYFLNILKLLPLSIPGAILYFLFGLIIYLTLKPFLSDESVKQCLCSLKPSEKNRRVSQFKTSS